MTRLRLARPAPSGVTTRVLHRGVTVVIALLVLAAPARAQRIGVTSAKPDRVELKPTGAQVKVELQGSGLEVFTRAVVVVDGRVSADFDTDLSYDKGRRELIVSLAARPGAAGRSGRLYLMSPDQRLEVPQLTLSVALPPLPELTGVSLDKSGVATGEVIQGTVEFDGPLPRDLAVELSSSDEAVATVPEQVDVAGGATSASFEITGGGTSGAVTISARFEGVEVDATVYVTAPFTPQQLTVGDFAFTAAKPDRFAVFVPVELTSIGTFEVTIQRIDPYATFTPVSLDVGTFTFVVQPLAHNEPPERSR